MQLDLTLTVWRLKILCKLFVWRKCLSSKRKKATYLLHLPFLLKGGLNQIMFLYLFYLCASDLLYNCSSLEHLHIKLLWNWILLHLMNYGVIFHWLRWEVAWGFVENGWIKCVGRNVPFVRLNVTSKKLTSFRLVTISISNSMFLKMSIFFLVLSVFWPLTPHKISHSLSR